MAHILEEMGRGHAADPEGSSLGLWSPEGTVCECIAVRTYTVMLENYRQSLLSQLERRGQA